MRAVSTILLLFMFAQSEPQNRSKPLIAPFFDRADDGPAFFVECHNTTAEKISSGSPVWPSFSGGSVRLDGAEIPYTGGFGPGLTMDVAPGQLWRGIIVRRQSERLILSRRKFWRDGTKHWS